jgi:hypothetical protein
VKATSTLLLLILISFSVLGQNTRKDIKEIKAKFKQINSQVDYSVVEVTNYDIGDDNTCMGYGYRGYYRNDTLHKIVDISFKSYGREITEYYFSNNKLIFAYHLEDTYRYVYDSTGEDPGFDYNITDKQFDSRVYYKDKAELKRVDSGKSIFGHYDSVDYESYSSYIRSYLDNRHQYLNEYNMLGGEWALSDDTTATMEIEGFMRYDYFRDKSLGSVRVKIENSELLIFPSDDESMEKVRFTYSIIQLTTTKLSLQNSITGQTMNYNKK